MRIGYGRVSTREQHSEAQHDALVAAGCEQVFLDTASGTLARRPELDKALLSANRPGDQFVVTKLDRLGRSLENLIELSKTLQERGVDLVVLDQGIDTSTALGRMFFQIIGSIAEFEHALMSERTRDGSPPPGPAGAPAGKNPSSARARSNWPAKCTRKPTPRANAPIPSSRSPGNSASPAPPFTGTWPNPERGALRPATAIGRHAIWRPAIGTDHRTGPTGRGPRGPTLIHANRLGVRWRFLYRESAKRVT
jgi:hypothetical protein